MCLQQAQEEQRGDQTHAPPLEQRSVSSPTMLVSPLVRSPSDGSDISGRGKMMETLLLFSIVM